MGDPQPFHSMAVVLVPMRLRVTAADRAEALAIVDECVTAIHNALDGAEFGESVTPEQMDWCRLVVYRGEIIEPVSDMEPTLTDTSLVQVGHALYFESTISPDLDYTKREARWWAEYYAARGEENGDG